MINANDLIMIRHNKNKGKLEISDGLIFPSVKEMKKAIKEQRKQDKKMPKDSGRFLGSNQAPPIPKNFDVRKNYESWDPKSVNDRDYEGNPRVDIEIPQIKGQRDIKNSPPSNSPSTVFGTTAGKMERFYERRIPEDLEEDIDDENPDYPNFGIGVTDGKHKEPENSGPRENMSPLDRTIDPLNSSMNNQYAMGFSTNKKSETPRLAGSDD
jgi:hypothetical protein